MTATAVSMDTSNTLVRSAPATAAAGEAFTASATQQAASDCVVAAREPSPEQAAIARKLVRDAKSRGLALTGPDGLLKTLTRTVLEAALEEEMSEHLGMTNTRCPDTARGTPTTANGLRRS